jgi:hypothetical protein
MKTTEQIELGPVPYEEQCQQLGPSYDAAEAQRECTIYMMQLVRQHGAPPDGVRLRVKGFPHDFGFYYEVVVSFDSNDEKQAEYAYKLESDGPANWDTRSIVDLAVRPDRGWDE